VSPALLVRLTAALSSGLGDHPDACPGVRFDYVGAQLIMTVVLEDGRQVARVLPNPGDAAPTLVALTAVPRVSLAPSEPEAPTPTPETAPLPVVAPAAAPVADPTPTAVAARPVVPAARTPWPVRLGFFGTSTRLAGSMLVGAGLELDVTLPRWVFGLRGTVTTTRREESGVFAGVALTARARWVWSRWELDVGPAFGLRGATFDANTFAWTAGMESSVAFRLGATWSVFARMESTAVFADGEPLRRDNRGRDDDDDRRASDVGFAGTLALGIRGALP